MFELCLRLGCRFFSFSFINGPDLLTFSLFYFLTPHDCCCSLVHISSFYSLSTTHFFVLTSSLSSSSLSALPFFVVHRLIFKHSLTRSLSLYEISKGSEQKFSKIILNSHSHSQIIIPFLSTVQSIMHISFLCYLLSFSTTPSDYCLPELLKPCATNLADICVRNVIEGTSRARPD